MKFCDLLRKIRIEKRLSQSQLAQLAQLKQQDISRWESGICYPSFMAAYRLTKALDVSMDALAQECDET